MVPRTPLLKYHPRRADLGIRKPRLLQTAVGVLSVAVLLSASLKLHAEESVTPETRPNIIFIYADDWGWGDLSIHGNPQVKTPNIDRLAEEGTDFEQFNVLSPVCSASRVALMTGQYPARYSVHQYLSSPERNREMGQPDWLDPEAPTLARFLREAGYRTAHFGKWHLTSNKVNGAPRPEAYGYDESAVFSGGLDWPSAAPHETGPNAVAFIRKNADRPFFINVWLHESHTPHLPSPEAMELWADLDEQHQVYAAVITDGDRAVGKILDALDELGIEDRTLVIFSSDNGPEVTGSTEKRWHNEADRTLGTYFSVGETGGFRGRKRSLFEGGVRTPLIVRWPGHVPAGKIDDTSVITAADMLPTLAAAAGVTLPKDYAGDGENLLATLEGKAAGRTLPIFWEWQGTHLQDDTWPHLAVRDGDWKLTIDTERDRTELYNLAEDREESLDVAAKHPETVQRLTDLVLEWKATLPAEPNPACIAPTASR